MKSKVLPPNHGLLIQKRPLNSLNYMHWMFVSYIAGISFFFAMIVMLGSIKGAPLPERPHLSLVG